MSMQYCHNCDKHIDTDYDAEHFDVCGKEEQIEDFMMRFTDAWYGYVNQDHHKDRDCHFYITKTWSYGEKPTYEASHWGYVGDVFSGKFDTHKDAMTFMMNEIKNMLRKQKEWSDMVLADEKEWDEFQVNGAKYCRKYLCPLLTELEGHHL